MNGVRAGECSHLHIAGQGAGDRGLDGIDALAGIFKDSIQGIDDVIVVARTARHRIGTALTVEGVVGVVSNKGVGGGITGSGDDRGI